MDRGYFLSSFSLLFQFNLRLLQMIYSEEDTSETGMDGETRAITKTKFNDGAIIKTVLKKPYEVGKKDYRSLTFAAQVLTSGREETILEHLWVKSGIPIVRSYLLGKRDEEKKDTKWSLEYHATPTAITSQILQEDILEFLGLVISDFKGPSLKTPVGTKEFNLQINVPMDHADFITFKLGTYTDNDGRIRVSRSHNQFVIF